MNHAAKLFIPLLFLLAPTLSSQTVVWTDPIQVTEKGTTFTIEMTQGSGQFEIVDNEIYVSDNEVGGYETDDVAPDPEQGDGNDPIVAETANPVMAEQWVKFRIRYFNSGEHTFEVTEGEIQH